MTKAMYTVSLPNGRPKTKKSAEPLTHAVVADQAVTAYGDRQWEVLLWTSDADAAAHAALGYRERPEYFADVMVLPVTPSARA